MAGDIDFKLNGTEKRIIQRMTDHISKGGDTIAETLSAGLTILEIAISRVPSSTDSRARKETLEICELGMALFNAARIAGEGKKAKKCRRYTHKRCQKIAVSVIVSIVFVVDYHILYTNAHTSVSSL